MHIHLPLINSPSICFRELPTTSGINPVPQPRSTTYSTSSREEKNGYEVAPGFDQVLDEKRYKGRLSSGYPSEDILETRYGGRISPPPRRHYESPSEYQHTDSGYPSTSPVRTKCILQHRALWVSQNCFKCIPIVLHNYFAQHTWGNFVIFYFFKIFSHQKQTNTMDSRKVGTLSQITTNGNPLFFPPLSFIFLYKPRQQQEFYSTIQLWHLASMTAVQVIGHWRV